ncbi:hypothetical protein GCM10009863_51990 [Streptomyces axinellae]|uniref:Uncharacterized protein n=2 Tax=Streptomyces axinellae TaxID=552788 RepID=A0ABP6CWQ2_9ACTN
MTPEREAIIRQQQPGDWLSGNWLIREATVDGVGVWQVTHQGQVIATLPDWAGNLALWIAETHEDVPELFAVIDRLRARVAELEETVASQKEYTAWLATCLVERTSELLAIESGDRS